MRVIWVLATLLVCATAASLKQQPSVTDNGKIRYDNYKVYKLKINNKTQLGLMDFFQAKSDKYNVWKEYDVATKEVYIMVKPEEHSNFLHILKLNEIVSELIINNVQELIDEEASSSRTRSNKTDFDWTTYYELHEIEEFLDRTLAAHPKVTESLVIGKSYENRDIRGIKISYKSGNPGIFIESNIHAREWITSATATWFINELLNSKNETVRNLAENYDWYIFPVFNVDGFVYSHEKDRMWRKTRQPVESSKCVGTDANRNFDTHWLENGGASSNPCAETFAGPKPFSEPEADALAKYVTSIKDKVNIYISFHSFGQYLLCPYGHSSTEFPENYDDLQTIGEAFYDAIISLKYRTKYRYGSTGSVLYIASGASVDWMFNTLGIKLGYTIEFRDKGHFGFVLPPLQILPNCEELLAGMIALVDTARQLNYDRLWRKTRQPVESSKCVGTDGNRNFDSHWLENGGASSDPCSQNFAGPKPLSEPEAAALAKYVTSIKDKIKIYLTFHSISQVLLSPYGHSSTEFPENYDDMQTIGKAFCDAIFALPYKTVYRSGATASLMYIASGTSIDWVFNTLGVKIAYTIEFRDTGRYGHVLPPVQIVPNSEELLAGMIALVGTAKQLNYI